MYILSINTVHAYRLRKKIGKCKLLNEILIIWPKLISLPILSQGIHYLTCSAGPSGKGGINAEENCGEKPMNIIKRLIIVLAATQTGMVPTYAQSPIEGDLQAISATP